MFCFKNTMIGTSKSIWGFDPRSIPNCIVWLDGGDSNTMTPSTPSGGTQITAWLDKSVNGVSYASGAVPTYPGCNITPPTYVTGGGLNFNPSIPGGSTFTNNVTQGLSAVGGFPLNATGFTAFAVAVATGTMTSFNSYFSYFTGGAEFIDFNAAGGTFGQIITDTTGLNVTIPSTILTTTRQIQSVRSSTTGTNFFVNGSLSNSSVFNYTQVNNPVATVVWIGNQAPGFRSFSGTIFELLVYNQSLTSNQRQTVEGYLARKWAITLATTHPFSIIPPFNRYFNPNDIPGCSLWLDGADGSSVIPTELYAPETGIVTTLAGNGTGAFADGTGANARFNAPLGIAVFPNGDAVVADLLNHRIRLVTQAGVVTTLAGNGTGAFADGTGANARFNQPQGVAVLPNGNIVVADNGNHRIRIVTLAGVVTTLAGSGTGAFADGTGAAASFRNPYGVAVLLNGDIVVSDLTNSRIRIVTQAGVVTTLAGTGTSTFADGTGAAAGFNQPQGVAVLPNGNIVLADYGNNRIRLITLAGVVTTLAGQATAGSTDATGTAASFNGPSGVAVTSTGVIVVGDDTLSRIRIVTQAGVVTTLAGSGTQAFANGMGSLASFNRPRGVAVLSNGNIVVSEYNSNRIRLISGGGVQWNDKSGLNNNVTGTATWTGSNVSFNGTTQFSNRTYVFPISNYSMFSVYSNTTAPAAGAYMNVVYGSNGFPMLGTFGTAMSVSARSVVANTGALANPVPVGWAARIAGTTTSSDIGLGIAGDLSGNVFVVGYYTAAVTLFNTGGTTGATLPITGAQSVFVAKYTSAGTVTWAAQIGATSGVTITGIITDSSGNAIATGTYYSAVTLYNTGGAVGATLAFTGGGDVFIAKYSSAGSVLWATRITGTSTSSDSGQGIAADPSGNVFVIGYYSAAVTLFNTGGTTGATLPFAGTNDTYVAKYSSAGTVLWAAQIASTTGSDVGFGIAADLSGNVFVIGYYGAALTLYNTSGTSGATLPFTGGLDVFVAKYSSAGAVLWAAQITGTTTSSSDQGRAIATDSSGNVFITGEYAAALALYNTNGTTGATLPNAGNRDCFIAKYSSGGAVLWAAQITSTGIDIGQGIATDSSGNVLVTGYCSAATTLYNTGGTIGATLAAPTQNQCFIAKYSSVGAVTWAARAGGTNGIGTGITVDPSGNVLVTGYYAGGMTLYDSSGVSNATLPFTGSVDAFLAKYSPNGYIIGQFPASSNVLVSATYTPSTFSPFVNGCNAITLAGTTLATTGIFVGGPSNYFNGTISELLIYSANLSAAQRQQVEGYLIQKWGLSAQTLSNHQYKFIPPATSQPAQFAEVTPGNWTRDWQPELRSLVAANASGVTLTGSNITGGATYTTNGWFGGTVGPDGNIYFSPFAATNILRLNVATGVTTNITGGATYTASGWAGTILGPDGNIYGTPYNAANILRLNVATGVTTNITGGATYTTAGWQGQTLGQDGNIYFAPTSATNVLRFNVATGVTTNITGGATLTANATRQNVLGPDGNIYFTPHVGSFILQLNVSTGVISSLTPSGITYNGSGGWQGSILGPDGNIYFSPWAAGNILKLTFSGLSQLPSSNYCLSAYANKY